LNHAQGPERLLQLFATRKTVVDAHDSAEVWDHYLVDRIVQYGVAESGADERVFPNFYVVFPAADEEVPTCF
jgi:hypothetical protein